MNTDESSIDKCHHSMKTAKVSFGVYIALALIGMLLVVIGFEDPGPSPKPKPFAGIDMVFGHFDLEFPEQFMALFMAGLFVMMGGWIAAIIASVASLTSMLKSSWSIKVHVWGIIILLLSLSYVLFAILILI